MFSALEENDRVTVAWGCQARGKPSSAISALQLWDVDEEG